MIRTHKIFRNAFYLAATNGLNMVMAFIFAKLTSGYLGPLLFGQMILVFSVTTFLESTMRGSLNMILTHRVAQNEENARLYWWPTLSLHGIFSIFFLLFSVLFNFGLRGGRGFTMAVLCGVLVSIFRLMGEVAIAIQRGKDHMSPEFWTTLMERLLYIGLVVLIIHRFRGQDTLVLNGFTLLFAANAVTQGLQALLLVIPTWLKLRPAFHLDRGYLNDLIRATRPLWISAVLVMLHGRLEIFMLQLFKMGDALGYFGAASKLLDVTRLVPWLLGMAMFPALTRQAAQSREEFTRRYLLTLKLFVVASLPVVILLASASNVIVRAVYSPQFVFAALPLRLLALAVMPLFLNSLFSFGAMAVEKQSLIAVAHLPALLVQLTLGAFLIHRYQAVGAACSVFLGDMTLLATSLTLTSRQIAPLRWDTLFRPLLSALIVGGALYFGLRYHSFVGVLFGLFAYVACLFLLRILSPSEMQWLKSVLKKSPPAPIEV